MKKEVFVFGTLQVSITTIFFTYIAHLVFSLDIKTSIVIGSALALSSTAIVLKVLNENGDIHRPYGRNSTGILIFQDIAVIPILLMITILSDSSVSLPIMLFNTLISAIIVGVVLYILGKYVTAQFLSYVVDTKAEELFIISILLIVLSSALFAHTFGFSYSLGAFLAGILIAETKYKWQIEADLVPFRDILLGIFFITVGMQVDFEAVTENFFLIIGLAIIILLLKTIIIFLILRIFTFTKRAIKTALTLAQVGEFSFAIFALATTNHLISEDITRIMIPVVIISLLFTSVSLRHVRSFVGLFQRDRSEIMKEPIVSTQLENHIIVCGYSLLGQNIVKNLKNSNITYVAIEHNAQHIKLGEDRDDIVFFGNAASKNLLESVYIKDAAAVIIAVNNDEKVRLICEAIKSIKKDILVIVKATHQTQIDDLKELEVDSFINVNKVIATKLIDKATKCSLEKF